MLVIAQPPQGAVARTRRKEHTHMDPACYQSSTYIHLPFERVILRTTRSSDFATDARNLNRPKAIAKRPRAARATGMYSDTVEMPSTTTAMGPMPGNRSGWRHHVSAAKRARHREVERSLRNSGQ